MKKKIIAIDENKCVGCGLCVNACLEGAIGIVDGKAKLLKEDYCDGLGNCLPVCPTDAINFIEKEVSSASAVVHQDEESLDELPCECPGTNIKTLKENEKKKTSIHTDTYAESKKSSESELMQWPVQINLVPVNALYFDNSDLLIAADCTAYAYCDFHKEMMQEKITLIGCPKLDPVDYSEKLTEIIKNNDIKSVTVIRMEVPCCGGIQAAVETALKNSGKFIPNQVITISTDGRIIR